MGLVILLLLAVVGNASAQKRWNIDLKQKYGYERFDRGFSRYWYDQQGVVFLTPDEVAVFQTRQNSATVLSTRDATGGGGNFFLQIEVLDARDGHEIKSLHLPTNATAGYLMPTHDGMFLVRTGDMLYVYSADFQQISSKLLPLEAGQSQWWEVKIPPSGKFVVAARQSMPDAAQAHDQHHSVEVLRLNADTLAELKSLTVPRLVGWSAEEDLILCWDPYQNRGYGLLNNNGDWGQIEKEIYVDSTGRANGLQVLSHSRLGVFGLKQLAVFTPPKQQVFSKVSDSQCFRFIRTEENFLGTLIMDCIPPGAEAIMTWTSPGTIELYDLRTKKKVLDFPLPEIFTTFDFSSRGDLVLAHGSKLEFIENRHLQ